MHHKTLKRQMFLTPNNIVKMPNQFKNKDRYKRMRVNLTQFSSEVKINRNNKLKLQLASNLYHSKHQLPKLKKQKTP